MLVSNHQTTLCNNPENQDFYFSTVKPWIVIILFVCHCWCSYSCYYVIYSIYTTQVKLYIHLWHVQIKTGIRHITYIVCVSWNLLCLYMPIIKSVKCSLLDLLCLSHCIWNMWHFNMLKEHTSLIYF
jgi:hypothetical protein